MPMPFIPPSAPPTSSSIGTLMSPVSGYCIACIPGNSSANDFPDLSGNNANIVFDTFNTTAFSTPSYMTVGTGNGQQLVIPAEKFLWSPSTEWLIFAFVMNKAAPAASQALIGISASLTAGIYGIYLSHRTSGSLKPVQVLNGVTGVALADSTLSFSDATPQDRHCVLAIDPLTGSAYLYRDGILSDTYYAAFTGANAFPAGITTAALTFGGLSLHADLTYASIWRGVQVYKGTGALPNNLGSIARRLAANPDVPLRSLDFNFPIKKMVAAIIGQSNEQGPAGGNPAYKSINNGDGCPMIEGSSYHTGTNAWWVKLGAALGHRRLWMQMLNTAKGTTGLTDTWVGCVRAYVGGMVVGPGSYTLDANGHIYKAVGGTMTPGLSATSGAAFVLNVTPSAGVGTSGLTSWTDLGLASSLGSQYVAGYVCVPSDALFDPNGLMVATKNLLVAAVGFDTKVCFLSIGQGDKTFNDTANQFRDAIVNATNYITSFGIHMFVCMTITAPTVDAFYTSTLLPGRAAAIAILSSNSLAHVGADLATGIRALANAANNEVTAQPATMTPKVAMQNNAGTFLHGNAVAMSVAANLHDVAMQTAGF
jgi:hypothetical protein